MSNYTLKCLTDQPCLCLNVTLKKDLASNGVRLRTKLTYCGNYGTDKVECPREVPARSQSVHTDTRDEGLLIVPQ